MSTTNATEDHQRSMILDASLQQAARTIAVAQQNDLCECQTRDHIELGDDLSWSITVDYSDRYHAVQITGHVDRTTSVDLPDDVMILLFGGSNDSPDGFHFTLPTKWVAALVKDPSRF